MTRLPVLSGIEFIRIMEKIGYTRIHPRGSHMILVHETRLRL